MNNLFKTLTLAAAVLLATSCSKDDSNDVAAPASKSIRVSFTVGYDAQSLSKVSVDPNANYKQTFEKDDEINFNAVNATIEGSSVYKCTDADEGKESVKFVLDVTPADGKTAEDVTIEASLGKGTAVTEATSVDDVILEESIKGLVSQFGFWYGEARITKVEDKYVANGFTLQQQNAFVVNPGGVSFSLNGEDRSLCFFVIPAGTEVQPDGKKAKTAEKGDVMIVSTDGK